MDKTGAFCGSGSLDVLTTAKAPLQGVSIGQLRGPNYFRLLRGVYAPRDAIDSWVLRAKAALAAAPEGTLLWGHTALRMMGVALPESLDRDRRVHLLVPHGTHRLVHQRRIVTHQTRLPVPEPLLAGEIPVCPPLDALLQAAALTTADEWVQLAEGLVRYTNPIVDFWQLVHAVRQAPARPGRNLARLAIGSVRAGTESIRETELRQLVVAAGFPEPEVNHVLLDQAGQFVARVDLWWQDAMVAGEYDGSVHAEDTQRRKDVFRRRAIENLGARVVVATVDDLRRPGSFLAQLKSARQEQLDKLRQFDSVA